MKNNKFTNDLTDASLHTSVFAEAAGGEFGSTSLETFEQRLKLQQNRKVIRGYRDSLVGRAYSERPPVQVPQRPTSEVSNGESTTRQASNSINASFREPPARGYNPFA